MALLIEAISVVIRCEAIATKFSGGIEAFTASIPNNTLCADGELVCISFMTSSDVQHYVEYLMRQGLIYKNGKEQVIDIVVIDQLNGMTRDCHWVEFGSMNWNDNPEQLVSVCSSVPTKTDRLFVPEGWNYESSLTANHKYIDSNLIPENFVFLRREGHIDVFWDKDTEQEFYMRRT